jgi:hypothetical protein
MINRKKYTLVFILTCVLFFSAFSISNYLNDRKVNEIKSTEDKISIDILSNETQYELLQQSSCSIINSGSVLSDELSTLADKLSYAEAQEGIGSTDVQTLKEYYSLLEIKDFLLVQQIYKKCNTTPSTILYFYSNKGDCPECTRQGYVLTQLRQDHPKLRVYNFDYDLNVNAIHTLTSLYKIPRNALPALVMDGATYTGFKSTDDITKIFPELAASSSPAGSTASSTRKVK